MSMNWPRSLWRKYRVVATPSRMMDFKRCPRKDWFRKVARLPENVDEEKFLLGRAFHKCAENIGRGQDPWLELESKLNDFQKELLRAQVQIGQSVGVLRRRTDAELELPVWMEVTLAACMIGTFDIQTDVGVGDYKTVYSRRWLPTPEDLKKDPKMLSYARMWQYNTGRIGSPVELDLHCFSKKLDDMWYEPVSVTVEDEEIEEFWQGTVIPTMKEMERMAAIRKVEDVPRDESGQACRDYGGCPFLDVCNGWETIPEYRSRLGGKR